MILFCHDLFKSSDLGSQSRVFILFSIKGLADLLCMLECIILVVDALAKTLTISPKTFLL